MVDASIVSLPLAAEHQPKNSTPPSYLLLTSLPATDPAGAYKASGKAGTTAKNQSQNIPERLPCPVEAPQIAGYDESGSRAPSIWPYALLYRSSARPLSTPQDRCLPKLIREAPAHDLARNSRFPQGSSFVLSNSIPWFGQRAPMRCRLDGPWIEKWYNSRWPIRLHDRRSRETHS